MYMCDMSLLMHCVGATVVVVVC